jgi:signal transduction histidine kinase
VHPAQHPDARGELKIIINSRDVTERQQAEKELRASNQRLEQALADLEEAQARMIEQERLRALGQMASGIAHDFNNALAPILGFTDLLLHVAGLLDDRKKVTEYLGLVNLAAKDAASVVRRLREFSRPREETEIFVPVELPQLVEQVVTLTQPKWRDQARAEGRNIAVRTDLEAVPAVSADEAQLREALTNLLFNAVDAMPEGGTLALRTFRSPNGVILEISDTGIGMTEEVRRHCMEPFYSTKGKDGTGLGLPMVYGILQRHGASIELQSEPGTGTHFRICFPLDTQVRAPGASPSPRVQADVCRVLVVDDEPLVQQVTAAYLAVDGHAVVTAGSGAEALGKLAAAPFDLVITDQAMPGMSGEQLAAQIKERAPGLPVILLTGFASLMEAEGGARGPIDLILGKPVALAALREAVAKVMAGRQ